MSGKWEVIERKPKNAVRWAVEAVIEEGVDRPNPASPDEFVYDIRHVDTHETKRVLSHHSFEIGDRINEEGWSREL